MTSTVEGPFGSQIVAEGMVLNNELTDFTFAPEKDGAPVANRVEAGKRPLSSMAPTIVYDAKGRVVLALGLGRRQAHPDACAQDADRRARLGAAGGRGDRAAQHLFRRRRAAGGAGHDAGGDGAGARAARPDGDGRPISTSKVNAIERTPGGWRGAADPRSEGVALAE